MKSVRFALLTVLSVALPLGILGCSSESEPAAPAGGSAPEAASAAPGAAPSDPEVARLTPEETAEAFMDAGMTGDEEGVNALLTAKALESIQSGDGSLEIHDMPFDEYTIGESEETDDGFAVGVQTVEDGEVTDVKLLMRDESDVLKIFGVEIDFGDGMKMTMNLENIENMMEDMLEGMVEGMGEALEQSFSSMTMGGTEEELAKMKAQFDALGSVTMADFEASWKNAKDYAGSTAKDALAELAAELDLSIHSAGVEDALAQEVAASVEGLSKLEAIEVIANEAGLYPVYPEERYGFGALGDAMVDGMTSALEGAVEGLDIEAAREQQAAAEPTANAIQFMEGERPLPVAFSGPFLFEVAELTENAPMPTGEISFVVRTHGLNLGILKLLSDDSDSTIFEELVDAKGNSLIEENIMYMSGGQIFGSGYTDRFNMELKNLIREVEAIASFKGTQRITIPLEVQELTFEGIAADQTQTVGDLTVKVVEAGTSTKIEVTGPAEVTNNVKLNYWALNEVGETVPINFDFVDDWTEGVLKADLDLMAEPHTVLVKMTTASEAVVYPFAFENIPLQKFSEAPEQIEALSFEGHEMPVTITMKEITDADDSFGEADFTIANHTNKDILTISVSMEYFDATDEKLDDFPSTFQGPFTTDGIQMLVESGATVVRSGTAFSMPEGTVDIRPVVRTIEFTDGTEWQGDDGF